LRVEEYLLIEHGRTYSFYVREDHENGQRDTVRIVWKRRTRVKRQLVSGIVSSLAAALFELLATIAAPEARYTLECFPVLFALGGVAM
jgi:hypothetical protein